MYSIAIVVVGALLVYTLSGIGSSRTRPLETAEPDHEDDTDEDMEAADLERGGIRETVKLRVELGDGGDVYRLLLPLTKVESWDQLSRRIREVCERSKVVGMPKEGGAMKMVLRVGHKDVPVTTLTRFAEVHRANCLRIFVSSQKETRHTGMRAPTKQKVNGTARYDEL